MMIMGSPKPTEALLLAGDMPFPGCSARLRPHGHASTGTVRGPGDERLTVPASARPLRRLWTHPGAVAGRVVRPPSRHLEVIGTSLAAKAAGNGHRTIATQLGWPLSTVRRWLRQVPEEHVHWLHGQAVQHAFHLDPNILVRPKRWPCPLSLSLNILAGAALAHHRRVDSALSPWTLIGLVTRGKLLGPPLRT